MKNNKNTLLLLTAIGLGIATIGSIAAISILNKPNNDSVIDNPDIVNNNQVSENNNNDNVESSYQKADSSPVVASVDLNGKTWEAAGVADYYPSGSNFLISNREEFTGKGILVITMYDSKSTQQSTSFTIKVFDFDPSKPNSDSIEVLVSGGEDKLFTGYLYDNKGNSRFNLDITDWQIVDAVSAKLSAKFSGFFETLLLGKNVEVTNGVIKDMRVRINNYD